MKNRNVAIIKQVLNQEPQGRGGKSMRDTMRETLCLIAKNETMMKKAKESNPQLYDLTMKVALEEERRKSCDNER